MTRSHIDTSLVIHLYFAAVAQLAERRHCKSEVAGSTPARSTNKKPPDISTEGKAA